MLARAHGWWIASAWKSGLRMVNVSRAENEKPAVRMARPNIPIAVWFTRSVSTFT